MDSTDYLSLVLYYGRARLFHSMQKVALDGLAKFPSQSSFRLFNGFALALGNRVQEGIRELNPLKNESELSLSAIHALIYAHNHCAVVDKNAVDDLKYKLQEYPTDHCSVQSIYYVAVFYYLARRMPMAGDYTDKAVKVDGLFEPATILKAWIELAQQPSPSGNILRVFETVLKHGKHIDATLGQVRYYQLKGQFPNAINSLNKLSLRFPELNIPFIEKMETELAAFDWEQAYETALRIINLEPTNIFALRVKVMLLITRESNFKDSVVALEQLYISIEHVETGNYDLILKISQLFSRIASRNRDVLALTLRYTEKIRQLNVNNVTFITEVGYQRFMCGDIVEAMACFRSAMKVDGNYFSALCGLTMCQIIDHKDIAAVGQQMQLLEDLQNTAQLSPLLNFLKAKSSGLNVDGTVSLLIEAADAHLKRLDTLIYGPEYLRLLNPDFLLQVATELLSHCNLHMSVKLARTQLIRESVDISVKHCARILEVIVRACPGHMQALHMRARVEYLCGDKTKAIALLQHLLNDIDPTCVDAQLLLAQIYIQQQQFTKATQSLDLALSHNFAVRDNPMYHFLLGIIQKSQRQFADAQKSFLAAMQLVGCSYVGLELELSAKPLNAINAAVGFSVSDKVTLYLELMDTFQQSSDMQELYESERLLQCAIDEFSNTAEEGRLVIARADLLTRQCKITQAISLLSAIQPNEMYYIQAKTHLANIYLQHNKDRVAYANCFKEMVRAWPKTESYLMLGEAYMSIQEPNLAVEAYGKALNMNPHDPLLASKLGRSYVKTHQYSTAIVYYQDALKSFNHTGLKLDLAELYLKLRQYKNATDLLVTDIKQNVADDEDVFELQVRTKELLLLARIQEKSGNIALALQTLKGARDNQHRVQKRISVDASGSLDDQYKTLSTICLQMAQLSIQLRCHDDALLYLKDCIRYSPNDIELLTSLARLHMQMDSMDSCKDVCVQILQLDSNNEEASVMMADLSFRKMEFDNSAYHFTQLLLMKPNYWVALARLIEVMRRLGALKQVTEFLARAEQATVNAPQSCGFNYCKGLYEWYQCNPNSALRYFAAARRDYEWGQQAIYNMIEVCINPDGDISSSTQDTVENGYELNESRGMALRTAERLLKDLRPRPSTKDSQALNQRLLHNFIQVASKQKYKIESAIQDFTALTNKYPELVGPAYGLALSLIQLKQTQRAKNHLKRISRMHWNFEQAEYLERSWLLLADIYIGSNKLDVSENLLDRVLEHNKSCAKSYELKGCIAEKSQLYMNAAKLFESSWNYGGRSKPNIGYKVAYNYMKGKRYADAIDICLQVIKLYPDYIVIRKDIFEKCRHYLRP